MSAPAQRGLRSQILLALFVAVALAFGLLDFVATRLSGPDGPVAFPSASRPTILNVWLQACADCMPAFEAARALEEKGGLGLDAEVVNVAYGEAEPSWAARYGVRQNLVYDRGGASVVKPLGISSFTTLVLDRHGEVVHTDRPDRAGYAERVGAAVASAKTRE